MDTEVKTRKHETDVEQINKLLDSLHERVTELRERAFKLHEPPSPEVDQAPEEPSVLVGRQIIQSLCGLRGRLEEALEALRGFN